MRTFHKSIQFKVTQLTVLFTLALTILLGGVSYIVFQNYARNSVIQATEFNLRLVAGLVRQDLINLNALSNWCTVDSQATGFLSDAQLSPRQNIDAWTHVRNQHYANRSALYVQRLIITDRVERILQVGGAIVNDAAINRYNLHTLPGIESTGETLWQNIVRDPFASGGMANSFVLVRPMRAPITRRDIGVVYMLVSTELVTDQLKSYQMPAGDRLYFTSGNGCWRVEENVLTPEPAQYTVKKTIANTARDTSTRVELVEDASGVRYTRVSCPLGMGDMELSHLLSASTLSIQHNLLLTLLVLGCIFIQILGLGIAGYLNRLIIRPVDQIRRRINTIAGGDFSPDTAIEWDNELGDVGRGINQLSRDVLTLMDNRLSDEKKRQQLEYKMLQSQINPHFIYNTLNSIKWMATIQNATGIAEMTTAFSRLLKSVAKSNEELIPLREEFALLNDYCTIQRYRYGGSITLDIADISDEELCECLIPRFTLQPLAENAIFHGIEPKGGVGSIWLHICQETDGVVRITMEDDGVGMSAQTIAAIFEGHEDEDQQKFKQVGVRNVHSRLQFAFGAEYGITAESEPGRFTRMTIRIPDLRLQNLAETEEGLHV